MRLHTTMAWAVAGAVVLVAVLLCDTIVLAQVDIEWVIVGDLGNVGELRGEGAGETGPNRVSGAVDYVFRIGKYEVSNGQYIEFLNAVAAIEDTHELYNTTGQEGGMPGTYGGIERTGTAGDYNYGPKGGDDALLNRPVNFISFYDALRFANWMHNGQADGMQDSATTEDGAYDMSLGATVVRKPGARFFIPSEDECFNAGYYKGEGTTAGYWDFQTQSDTVPVCEAPPGGTEPPGSAHYYCGDGQAVGPPYYTTEIGAYTHSPSPYGTFDQAGNMGEWGEDVIDGNRITCGLPWGAYHFALRAENRIGIDPLAPGGYHIGFRLASVYEVDASVPVTSTWGLVTMVVLLITVATAVVNRMRSRGMSGAVME